MVVPTLALDLWAMPGPGFLAAVVLILSVVGVLVFRGRISAKRDTAALADVNGRLGEAQGPTERSTRSNGEGRRWSADEAPASGAKTNEIDLDGFLKSQISELAPLAGQEGVRLSYDGPETPIPVQIEIARWGEVVSSLVSNALAHTPSGGEVTVYLLIETTRHGSTGARTPIAKISIADTGTRLSPDEAARFFEPDPDVSASEPRERDAGSQRLVAARDYVVAHGGTLSVRPRAETGCVFTLEISLWSGQAVEPGMVEARRQADAGGRSDLTPEMSRVTGGEKKPTVLLVDDDEDLLVYLEQALQGAFRPMMARNGREALDLLKVEPLDLVLCDHGMPVMDGIELLEAVRADESLRTIPFVLLTGRATVQDRVDGLRRGADAYIAKPFVVAEVVVQMQNLLRLRETMREQYGAQVFRVEATAPEMQSADALFVAEARRIVEAHMADPDFDVRAMADRLFVSERTLRRRVRDLTGFSAAKFILELRLQRARQLVDGNVVKTLSEAAAAVGFRDPGYFSRLLQSWRRDMMPDEE